MIRKPHLFEVIVTNNMFGDIVTDLGAALQGGSRDRRLGQPASGQDLDVRAGARLGAEVRRRRYRANPLAAILTSVLLMLDEPRTRGGRRRPSRAPS